MRLSTLNPTLDEVGGVVYLEFDCPAHPASLRQGDFRDSVRIPIATPLEATTPHVWGWNGERDFEKLTITPSVDYHGHWHGHVTAGEVT
jgi:uncharacterized protein DUF6527